MLLAVTWFRLKSVWLLPQFLLHSKKTFAQAEQAPGQVLVDTRSTGLTQFWTMSVWESEEQMKAYLYADAHGEAMGLKSKFVADARSYQWSLKADPNVWEQLLSCSTENMPTGEALKEMIQKRVTWRKIDAVIQQSNS